MNRLGTIGLVCAAVAILGFSFVAFVKGYRPVMAVDLEKNDFKARTDSLVDVSKANLRGSSTGTIVGKMVRNEVGNFYRYLIVKTDATQVNLLVDDAVFTHD